MASEVFDVSVDNFGCLGRQFRRHARLVWRGRLAVPDMDDLYAGRGDCRGQHGRQLGGEQARPLFRRQHLDVHALRDPHRYLQPFRIQRKELQRVQRRRASRQPRLIQMRGGEAPADLRARVLLDIAEMQGAKVLPPSYAIG